MEKLPSRRRVRGRSNRDELGIMGDVINERD